MNPHEEVELLKAQVAELREHVHELQQVAAVLAKVHLGETHPQDTEPHETLRTFGRKWT